MQIEGLQSRSTGLASVVSKASRAVYFDPMDTNRNGIVSPAEAFAYTLTHPQWEAKTSSRENNASWNLYTRQGRASDLGRATQGLFDVYR